MNTSLKTCLVLVCGPPGIGKSTFCKELNAYIKNKIADKICLQTFTISYDDLIDTELESVLIGEHQNDWKLARSMIFQLVNSFVKYLNQSETRNFQDFLNAQDPTSTDSMSEIHNLIKQRFFKTTIDSNLDSKNINWTNLIFLDDLFYYESMRYSFYRLAIDLECAYMSFCFKVEDLNFLFERNFNRDQTKKLNNNIIKNVFEKFEYSNKNEWEMLFTRVELIDDTFRLDEAYLKNSSEEIFNKIKEFSEFLNKRKLDELIRISQQNDEKAIKLIHECDLVLRKLISEKLSSNLLDNKELKSSMAKELSKKKSIILNEIKLDLKGIKTRLIEKVSIENLEKRLVIIESEIKDFLELK